MGKFRVLHLIRPAAGGMKNHLLTLFNRLNPELFELVAACPEGPPAAEIARAGGRVFTLPLAGELSFRKDWESIRRLAQILKEEKIVVLHAHGAKAGFVGRLAARMAKTPVIFLTVHNSIFYEERPAWKKMILAAVERTLNGFTDRIITVSEALRQELILKEGVDPGRVVTIYNGIEPVPVRLPRGRRQALAGLGLPPFGQVVGTIARLAPQKGVDCFLKAAAMLIRDYQVNFVIVGDGPLRRRLEAEAVSLGLENRVVFTGEREDVPAILPVFDIFVLTSLTEGFPLAILEALAAARPVIATRVGGIPEVIVDNYTGLLVKPGDPAGLALAIAELLSDREKAVTLGRTGQARVKEKFTAAQMVRRLEEEYVRALAAKDLPGKLGGRQHPAADSGVRIGK